MRHWISLLLFCLGASQASAQALPTYQRAYVYNSNLANLTVGLQVGNGKAPNVFSVDQKAPVNFLAFQQIQLVPPGSVGVNLGFASQTGLSNFSDVMQLNAGVPQP